MKSIRRSENILSAEDLARNAEEIGRSLQAKTWRNLETQGKFSKNDKLSFIKEDMLILGCDIGSEAHYLRAIDFRGKELSKSAFPFSNSKEGLRLLAAGLWRSPLFTTRARSYWASSQPVTTGSAWRYGWSLMESVLSR